MRAALKTTARTSLKRLLPSGLALVVSACPATTPSEEDADDGCPLGRFTVSSVLFEESGCLDAVDRDSAGVSAGFGAALTWQINAFSAAFEPGVFDDSNSSASGRYEREGLVWVAFTGAIGGTPLGESTASIDTLDDDGWAGTIDGVAVPDEGNDSLESVFVTIIVGGD